jgi:hypothetical protein
MLHTQTYATPWENSPSASSVGSCPAPADERSWPPIDTVVQQQQQPPWQHAESVKPTSAQCNQSTHQLLKSMPCNATRTFADSLYARLTPYSITSAPSIASLIASMVDPFIFVKSNQVTYDRAISDSFSRWIVACTFHWSAPYASQVSLQPPCHN